MTFVEFKVDLLELLVALRLNVSMEVFLKLKFLFYLGCKHIYYNLKYFYKIIFIYLFINLNSAFT